MPFDLQDIRTKVRDTALSSPPVSKALFCIIWLCYALSFTSAYDFLSLNPGNLFPTFNFWSLITAGFVEKTLLSAIVSAVSVVLMGKFVEPLWGSREFAKFILIIDVSVNIGVFFAVIFAYMATKNEQLLYAPVNGFAGVLSGLCVVFKQITPEHPFSIGFRAKHIPSSIAVLCFIFVILRVSPVTDLVMVIQGITFGWIYLRFYQSREGSLGDSSDSFAFTTFFPERLQPFVGIITTNIYAFLRKFRILRIRDADSGRSVQMSDFVSNLSASGLNPPTLYSNQSNSTINPIVNKTGSSAGADVQIEMEGNDAERRRQIALQALDRRLGLPETNNENSSA